MTKKIHMPPPLPSPFLLLDIKIGQHLSNLDYLLPREVTETLKVLLNRAPVSSYEDVCAVIKEELGKTPAELWSSFDPVPIASASLAQVRREGGREGGREGLLKSCSIMPLFPCLSIMPLFLCLCFPRAGTSLPVFLPSCPLRPVV